MGVRDWFKRPAAATEEPPAPEPRRVVAGALANRPMGAQRIASTMLRTYPDGRQTLREHRVEEYRPDGAARTVFRMYFGEDGMPVKTWRETATPAQVKELIACGGDPDQAVVVVPEPWPDERNLQ